MMALLLLPSTAMTKDSISQEELAKIEFLIASVEKQKDAQFIRNGKAYKADIAGRFLRGKWKAKSKEILTAEDFIGKVATMSSTTGKPYLIRFADGKEMGSGEYLRGLLGAIEGADEAP